MADLVVTTDRGLYCPPAVAFIDPWAPAPRAIVTHAHSDHAAPGCGAYLTSASGVGPLRARVGVSASIEGLAWGETRRIGDVMVSLRPAGHLLGSAQVVLEAPGSPRWVISGDYKVDPDPTCEAFEAAACDVFLTESTFGLPVFRWPDQAEVVASINEWWRRNAAAGRTTILLAYALGKAQRVLAGLDPSIGPIGAHGAVLGMCEVYRAAGIALPETLHANADNARALRAGGVIVAPPAAAGSPWIRRFVGPEGVRAAMVSGWMRIRGRRRWQSLDRGFVLSDHADWDGLIGAVKATGASRIGVTHGYASQFARWLGEQGYETFVAPTRYRDEENAERDGARQNGGEGDGADDAGESEDDIAEERE
ncbi:MAG: ligase-associated DNA damage response exonuclease [Phycisphaerales bacterium JB039]